VSQKSLFSGRDPNGVPPKLQANNFQANNLSRPGAVRRNGIIFVVRTTANALFINSVKSFKFGVVERHAALRLAAVSYVDFKTHGATIKNEKGIISNKERPT